MYIQQVISVLLVATAVFAVADDSVQFLAKPASLHFTTKHEKITSVQLANVMLTSMGFTVDLRNGGWNGAYISSPFNPPRVVIGLRVRDIADFASLTGQEIPLVENLKWDEFFSILVERGEKRLDNLRSDYFLVNEDGAAANSVSLMDRLSKDVVENGTVAPMVYFADMTKAAPVTSDMDESLKKLAESVAAYNGFLVLVKSSDAASHHSRRVRQAGGGETTEPDVKKMNLAPDVDEDYPIVFNIILFISLTLLFALIAITVAIATMDPGRDSLIYRVTSAQRFKKDN